MMLRLFDEVNALDEERRTTLQRFMTSLRTEKPLTALRKGDVLILEMCDRHGLDSPFAARYTEALRRYR